MSREKDGFTGQLEYKMHFDVGEKGTRAIDCCTSTFNHCGKEELERAAVLAQASEMPMENPSFERGGDSISMSALVDLGTEQVSGYRVTIEMRDAAGATVLKSSKCFSLDDVQPAKEAAVQAPLPAPQGQR